jgi:hypothetical protein
VTAPVKSAFIASTAASAAAAAETSFSRAAAAAVVAAKVSVYWLRMLSKRC